jgi:hypothetical protein
MNYELLKHLLSVQPGRHGTSPNESWSQLFNFYNTNKRSELPILGMGCQPCYDKVYAFCREYLQQELLKMDLNLVNYGEIAARHA